MRIKKDDEEMDKDPSKEKEEVKEIDQNEI